MRVGKPCLHGCVGVIRGNTVRPHPEPDPINHCEQAAPRYRYVKSESSATYHQLRDAQTTWCGYPGLRNALTKKAYYFDNVPPGVACKNCARMKAENEAKSIMKDSSHQNVVLSGLSSAAKRVYEAVPAEKPWPTNQIVGEIKKAGGNYSKSHVEGCLNQLVNSGLVQETQRGFFVRRKTSDAKYSTDKSQGVDQSSETIELQQQTAKQTVNSKEKSPIHLLKHLSEMVDDHIKSANKIKSEIDSAILEIDDLFAESEKKSRQLVELKNLLKGIQD